MSSINRVQYGSTIETSFFQLMELKGFTKEHPGIQAVNEFVTLMQERDPNYHLSPQMWHKIDWMLNHNVPFNREDLVKMHLEFFHQNAILSVKSSLVSKNQFDYREDSFSKFRREPRLF